MAQQTISCTALRFGMGRIGLDRLWLQMLLFHQRFTIKNPSEIKVHCLSRTPLNVIQKPEGGRTIRDLRHVVREDLAVESVLGPVSA